MDNPEQIKMCEKCGLHIVPGKEVQEETEWVVDPDGTRTSYAGSPTDEAQAIVGRIRALLQPVVHRDCDPEAVIAEFHIYREELRGSDATRIAAIAEEIRPTLEHLKLQAKRSFEEESKSGSD